MHAIEVHAVSILPHRARAADATHGADAARRLFTSRTGPREVQKTICYSCPATTTCERRRNHRLIGRDPWDFIVAHSENDTWNYFWSRRDAANRPALPGSDPFSAG